MTKEGSDPVFIVGSGRSGTTLLALILNTSPELSMKHETGILWHTLNDVPELVWRFGRDEKLIRLKRSFYGLELGVYGFDRDSFRRLIETSPTRRDFFLRFYLTEGGKPNAARWGENCPRDAFVMSELMRMFDHARFVHCYRDPRDVALSFLKAKFGARTLEGASRRWLGQIRLIQRWSRRHADRIIGVRYEDLVTDPETAVRRVADFTGVALPADWSRRFYQRTDVAEDLRRPIDAGSVGKWKTVPGFDSEPFLRYCGREMAELGYIDGDPYPHLEPMRQAVYLQRLSRIRINRKFRTAGRLVGLDFGGDGAGEED